jgi:hypothetical protein
VALEPGDDAGVASNLAVPAAGLGVLAHRLLVGELVPQCGQEIGQCVTGGCAHKNYATSGATKQGGEFLADHAFTG